MNFPELLRPIPLYRRASKGLVYLFDIDARAKPLLFATFFLYLGESVVLTVFNLYLVENLSLSYAHVIGIFSATVFAGAVFCLPLGYLCDHIGRRFVLFIGFYCWIFGLGGLVIFRATPLLYFFAAIHGTGMAAVWTAFSPILVDLTPPVQHVRAFSANFAMMFAGAVSGFSLGGLLPLFSPWLFGEADPYRVTLFIGCFLLFPANAYFSALPRMPVRRKHIKTRLGRLERRRGRILRLKIFIPYLFTGIAIGLILPFVNLFLKGAFDASDHKIGFSLAAVNLIVGVFIALIPVLAAKMGRIGLAAFSLVIAAPLLASVEIFCNPVLSVLLLILAVGVLQMCLPLQLSFAMKQYPARMRGFISSEMAIVWYIANGSGALLSIGFSGNNIQSLGRNYSPAAIFCVVGGVLYWLLWRKHNLADREKSIKSEHLSFSHGSSGHYFLRLRKPKDGIEQTNGTSEKENK